MLFNKDSNTTGVPTKAQSITFKTLLSAYGIEKIDFLKTDCEGGEYDIFTNENIAMRRIQQGRGLPPTVLELLLGQKSDRNYTKGDPIQK